MRDASGLVQISTSNLSCSFFFFPFPLETVSRIRNCHIIYYGPKVFFGKMGSSSPLNVDLVGFTQKN